MLTCKQNKTAHEYWVAYHERKAREHMNAEGRIRWGFNKSATLEDYQRATDRLVWHCDQMIRLGRKNDQ